jgi:hypothetical protein
MSRSMFAASTSAVPTGVVVGRIKHPDANAAVTSANKLTVRINIAQILRAILSKLGAFVRSVAHAPITRSRSHLLAPDA